MAGEPAISVVVPAYEAGAMISRCLEALERQTTARAEYEILVVDDGSSAGLRPSFQVHERLQLLSLPHAGPAAARNLGAQHARGDIVLFTDADCEPTRDWIEQMVGPFRDSEIMGVKGAYLTRQRELVARFVQAEYEEKYDHMARDRFIDFVDTYSAGYRRSLLLASGGFDATFPVACVEDQELSFRLAKQGHRLVFAPQARVVHWGHPRNLPAYWRRKFTIGYWKVAVIRKHPDKLLRDSHTPQVVKVQMLLAMAGVLSLPLGLLWWPAAWFAAAMGVLFLLSALPFVVKTWPRDRLVALLSPGLLFVRALALGAGFLWGLLSRACATKAIARR